MTGIVPVNDVRIVEEKIPTQAKFAAETVAWDATTGETEFSVTLDLPISILAFMVSTKGLTDGDGIALHVSPEKVIGNLPEDVAAEVTTIPLPAAMKAAYQAQSVILGMHVYLDDGSNKDHLGLLLSVDEDNDEFEVSIATVNAFLAATPTQVKLTASMTPGIIAGAGTGWGWNELFADTGTVRFGLSKIAAYCIPAGETIKIRFNNTGGSTVRVVTRLEFFY